MPLHLEPEKPPEKWQNAKTSAHAGHEPTDPRVAMVEEMAADYCMACSDGEHRWQDRQSGEFVHPDDTHPEAYDCEASNLLRIAKQHGVPLYTGAELEFPDDETVE